MSRNPTSRWVDEDEVPLVPSRGKDDEKSSIIEDEKSEIDGTAASQTATLPAPRHVDVEKGATALPPSKDATAKGTTESLRGMESTMIVPIPSELRRQAPFQTDHPPGAYPVSGPNPLRPHYNDQSTVSSGYTPSPAQRNQSHITGQSELAMTMDTTVVATVVDHRKPVPVGKLMRDRRVLFLLLLNVLVIAGLLAGVIILALDRSKGTQGANTPLSTAPVPIAPSTPPIRQTNSPTKFSQSVTEIISKAAPDGGFNLMNDTSPQFAALRWLLKDPSIHKYSDAQLLQRYALATFAFSSQPNAWSDRKNPELFGISFNSYGDECNSTTAITCNAAGLASILDLANGEVKASFPSELALLDRLETVLLYSNNLYGTIPSSLSRLQQLTHLSLGWNSLTGTLPTELSRMSRLEVIDVSSNGLTGTIPSEYSAMSALRTFVTNDNFMVGTIPTELLSLQKLNDLEVRNNRLTGTIPTEIRRLKLVSELDLSLNNFTGKIPAGIVNMISLQMMRIQDNQLEGKIPPFPLSIESINLNGNQLTGPIPDFSALTNLGEIQLGNNRLIGTIPTQLGLLDLGTSLVLSDNNLSGTIPTELGRFRQMTGDFQLQGNVFTGPIPSQLGFLTNLVSSFDLSFNTLNGTIPSELGNLVKLQRMYLQKNPSLGGTLPNEFGRLDSLVDLFAFETALNGTVPASLCSLTKVNLTDIYLNCDVDCACCQDKCF